MLALEDALHYCKGQDFVFDGCVNYSCQKVHALGVAQVTILLSVGYEQIIDWILSRLDWFVKRVLFEGAGRPRYIFLYLAYDAAHYGFLLTAAIQRKAHAGSISFFEGVHALFVRLDTILYSHQKCVILLCHRLGYEHWTQA